MRSRSQPESSRATLVVQYQKNKVKMPRSTASGLRITPAVAATYNYQIDPPSVEAEVNVYAKAASSGKRTN